MIYDGSLSLALTDVITTDRTSDFSVSWSLDGSDPLEVAAHIVLYGIGGSIIAPNTGPIVELLFSTGPPAQMGDFSPLRFSQVLLSDQLGDPIPVDFSDTGQFDVYCARDGDINDDGSVGIFDVQVLIDMILHTPQPDAELYPLEWWCRGDLQPGPRGDNQWNVFDLQRLVCLALQTCGVERGTRTGGESNLVGIGEVYACPSTSGAFDIRCDNEEAVYAAEIWFTYDSTIGLTTTHVTNGFRSNGWGIALSKDDGDPSAVVVHLLLYNTSGLAIDPGASGSAAYHAA